MSFFASCACRMIAAFVAFKLVSPRKSCDEQPTLVAPDWRQNQSDAPAIVQQSDQISQQVAKSDSAFSGL